MGFVPLPSPFPSVVSDSSFFGGKTPTRPGFVGGGSFTPPTAASHKRKTKQCTVIRRNTSAPPPLNGCLTSVSWRHRGKVRLFGRKIRYCQLWKEQKCYERSGEGEEERKGRGRGEREGEEREKNAQSHWLSGWFQCSLYGRHILGNGKWRFGHISYEQRNNLTSRENQASEEWCGSSPRSR